MGKIKGLTTSVIFFVIHIIYAMVISEMKSQCMFTPKKLIFELSNRFFIHKLMNSFGVIYA